MEKLEKAFNNIQIKIKNIQKKESTKENHKKLQNLKKIKKLLQKDWHKHYVKSSNLIHKNLLRVDLKVIRPKRMIVPNIYDLDDQAWANAMIEYKPSFRSQKFMYDGDTKYYPALALNVENKYIILKPTKIIEEAEFEDIFGKYDSLLELYISKKFPVLKNGKDVKIESVVDLMVENSRKNYRLLIQQIKEKVPYYPKFGYKYLQAQQDFNLRK